ncbi:16S rRNA m(7)G-527 methyltransferase [Psychromonas ingrahamii 37]|uniref:Ribosomal RNA small subunit methyltransferase G n=1 Tax=Psychromonas ingrahamii (strain DSM 17664 / CCUG 51855 / 37) TaxID=357804 RepID=RSMG_PSYIN|nr:16S rRNA (guanine(527)-N(7))-methyltransferase RsmG [Psychromonas ingrahamii]A1T0Z9.1 RecName: Full=Ribosomal RNA small subunit methyltransferase G; AltName: Full=16S rRNA 7-methylguanosine methyltransferase; Short=16S rRNA m7G methyltransferase [Psychromonas ingrahamii 37]ABM05414.1 16S rRNA m(7)G-527 methyltransferase [Psychromonas ingrahamii 37]
MSLLENLQKLIDQTSLEVTDQQKQQLVQLVELLNKWNKAYNLTSVRDPEQMLVKHIMDSIVVSPYLIGERFIDVGTGPGLPGLPLAILNPDKQFVLLDSLGKRLRFIRQALLELGLKNVTAVQSRVEEYQPEHKFDVVLSRAFASLHDMLYWCKHLPHEEGHFLALKGQFPAQEIKELDKEFEFVESISLQVPTLEGERCLVKIKRI